MSRYMLAILANPIRNNGSTGVFINATGAGAGGITSSLDYTKVGSNVKDYGSHVPAPETLATIAGGTDTRPTFKPYSAGNFAKMVAGDYIIRGVTTKLAGVSGNNQIKFGSDFGRKSIHFTENRTTTFLSVWTWTADKDGQPTYTFTVVNRGAYFQNDDAAKPTRAIPGEFTFMETGATPTNKDYPAITGQ